MKPILLFVMMNSPFFLKAQEKRVQTILETVHKKPLYKTEPAFNEKPLRISCGFGTDTLQFEEATFDPSKVQIIAIDLVFTDYPAYDDLKKLNSRRLMNLFKQYPSLEKNNSISWQLIRQTDGSEKENALSLFHGFVIYYKPLQDAALIKNDLSKLEEMLIPEPGPGGKKRNGFLAGDTTNLRVQYEMEEYIFVGKMPIKKAEAYLDIDERGKLFYKDNDSVFVYEKPAPKIPGEKVKMKAPDDSAVIKVLDRLTWTNMTVVADITGSMYPYTGQLLLWLKIHEEELRIKQFVFFNDGDMKDEDMKFPGRTGGIYSTVSSEFDRVESLVYKVMKNGSGGAVPENNIEALLHAQSSCNNCELLMIADNSSPVSDMVLLKQLNHPVHIIPCGIHETINTDLLDIARLTGGSIHLADKDITDLSTVAENETVRINEHDYKVVNGRFKVL